MNSHASVELKTNVSEIFSASIIKVDVIDFSTFIRRESFRSYILHRFPGSA
jgi:hypothetical protein